MSDEKFNGVRRIVFYCFHTAGNVGKWLFVLSLNRGGIFMG